MNRPTAFFNTKLSFFYILSTFYYKLIFKTIFNFFFIFLQSFDLQFFSFFIFQNSQPVASSWDYNQHHHMQPMYHHQQQAQPAEWYYDPNAHQPHGLYNNTYNNYKTDFNCLNQPPAPIHHPSTDPSMYNGGSYYYPQNPPADPYATAAQQQMSHPQMDYQHSNYHQNYHNSM